MRLQSILRQLRRRDYFLKQPRQFRSLFQVQIASAGNLDRWLLNGGQCSKQPF
jgi:hypothetical protein